MALDRKLFPSEELETASQQLQSLRQQVQQLQSLTQSSMQKLDDVIAAFAAGKSAGVIDQENADALKSELSKTNQALRAAVTSRLDAADAKIAGIR